MTAPSNANTSGLGVVAWRHILTYETGDTTNLLAENDANPWGVAGVDYSEEFSVVSEPLVTAASAQAEITSLAEAVRRAEINEVIWSDLADEHKARADRLAQSLEYIASLNCGSRPPETEEENNLGLCVAELQREARAALQQETQP